MIIENSLLLNIILVLEYVPVELYRQINTF